MTEEQKLLQNPKEVEFISIEKTSIKMKIDGIETEYEMISNNSDFRMWLYDLMQKASTKISNG